MSEQQDAAIAYALRLAVEQHEGNLNLGQVNHEAENDFWQIQLITDDDIHLIYEVWVNDSGNWEGRLGKEATQPPDSESPEAALALILSLLPKLKAQQLARLVHAIGDRLGSRSMRLPE